MRSGRRPHAAGRALSGPAPQFASTLPLAIQRFDSHLASTSPRLRIRLPLASAQSFSSPRDPLLPDFSLRGPLPHVAISNRHLVQLESAATHAKSTTSLFLIVTKRARFASASHPATLRSPAFSSPSTPFSSPSVHVFPLQPLLRIVRPAISTVYSMQLEFAATPTPSTNPQLLLCTPRCSATRATPHSEACLTKCSTSQAASAQARAARAGRLTMDRATHRRTAQRREPVAPFRALQRSAPRRSRSQAGLHAPLSRAATVITDWIKLSETARHHHCVRSGAFIHYAQFRHRSVRIGGFVTVTGGSCSGFRQAQREYLLSGAQRAPARQGSPIASGAFGRAPEDHG